MGQPSINQAPHYPGCWRDAGHHECAVVEVWRLLDALEEAIETLGTVALVLRGEGSAGVDAFALVSPLVLKWHRLVREVEERKNAG